MFFDIIPVGTRIITNVPYAIFTGIADHSRIVDDGDIPGMIHIVIVDISPAKIAVSHKSPLVVGYAVTISIGN